MTELEIRNFAFVPLSDESDESDAGTDMGVDEFGDDEDGEEDGGKMSPAFGGGDDDEDEEPTEM